MILTINNSLTIDGHSSLCFASDVSGLDRPNTQPVYYSLPRNNTSVISANRFYKREIKFKAMIIAEDIDDFYSLEQSIIQNTYNYEEPIPFSITTYETTPKTYLSSGYFNVTIPNRHTRPYCEVDFQILCLDPYFRGSEGLVSESVQIAQPGIGIPFDIPSDIGFVGGSTLAIDNVSSVPLYADCSITGPGTNFSIHNNTTNQTASLGNVDNIYNLSSGSEVIISKPTVIENGGQNRYNYLSSFEPFLLAVGSNSISFTVEGNNDANTIATVSYTPIYDRI